MLNTSSNKHLVLNQFFLTSILLVSLVLSVVQSPPSFGANPPSAPTYVEVMNDSSQVAVTWDVPTSNGGESLLEYTVRVWVVPPPTNQGLVDTCTTKQLGCVLGGYVSGVTYYVDVIASNSGGSGAPSAARSFTPGAASRAPTNVTATSDSKGLLTIRWTPITTINAGTFAWYAAEVFTSMDISIGAYSGFCSETLISASSCQIGGLKLGQVYYAQVRTVSSFGSGYPSSPRVSVIAGTSPTPTPTASTTTKATQSAAPSSVLKPSPIRRTASSSTIPRNVKATSLSRALLISWTPPRHTDGLNILGYHALVTAVGYHGKGWLESCVTSPKNLACTIKNLQPDQVYSVNVITVFASKESPRSKTFQVRTKS